MKGYDEVKESERQKTKEAEEAKAKVEGIYQAPYKQGINKKKEESPSSG